MSARLRPGVVFALVVVAVATVGPLVPGAVGQESPPSAKATVANVTVSPAQPAPGEPMTVTVSIRNGASTSTDPSAPFRVREVALRRSSGDRIAAVDDLGTLAAGTAVDVALTATFETSGTRELRVAVYGRDATGIQVVRSRAVVTVRESGVSVGFQADDDPVVGVETPVNVTVANGESTAVGATEVDLGGENVRVDDASRVLAAIEGGNGRSFTVDATPTARTATLVATVSYRLPSGHTREVERRLALDPEPLREDVRLDATVGNGASPPVEVDVENFGNAPLADASLRATAGGRVVARRSVDDVPPEDSRTVELNVTDVDAATLRITADYETGGRSGSADTRVTYTANPGMIRLTGVDVERADDRVHLSGSASNVGLSRVDGVVVAVVPAANVTPARPYREYFVGSVPASDFVSFDLYARLEGGVSTVPVRVTYIVDGERRSTVSGVNVTDLPPPQREGDGFSSLLLAAGVLAVLGLVGLGVIGYRRWTGGAGDEGSGRQGTDERSGDERPERDERSGRDGPSDDDAGNDDERDGPGVS
jgi:hypothetical protein